MTGSKTSLSLRFAGIWETWHVGRENAIESAAVATVAPSEEFQRFHDRQVFVLNSREEQDAWLDPDASPETLLSLLRPLPPGLLRFRPVGPAVNARDSHGPECIVKHREGSAAPLKIKRPSRTAPTVSDAQGELYHCCEGCRDGHRLTGTV